MTNLPPRLYHGTIERNVPQILRNGLLPSRILGNFVYTDAHRQLTDYIYLTEGRAPIYANNTAIMQQSRPVLIEIDTSHLNVENLRADEDYVLKSRIQASEAESPDEKVARAYELTEQHPEYWSDCLDTMGNLSFKGAIPVSAITRIVERDYENSRPLLDVIAGISNRLEEYPYAEIRLNALGVTRFFMGYDTSIENIFPSDFLLTMSQEERDDAQQTVNALREAAITHHPRVI